VTAALLVLLLGIHRAEPVNLNEAPVRGYY
jgi:hypothetical protein